MLEELEIRSLGPIRHARIEPHAGMNVITGETGAGKSMLLNAIELISGAQSQASRVGVDADQAWVQAIFDVSNNAAIQNLAESAGSACVDDQLFINRTVPKTGRSRAVLNGHSVPRTVLTQISSELVTIHGQSEQLKIASASKQRDFLDGFAANAAEYREYAAAFERYTTLKTKLEQLQGAQSEAVAQIDYLKDAIARIDAVDPHEGEEEELKSRLQYIENAAEIASAQAQALQALDSSAEGEGQSVSQLLALAIHELHSVDRIEQMAELVSRLESVNDEIQDIVYSLARGEDEEINPQELDTIHARIHDLDELTKRWGPTLKDVMAWKEKAQFDLEDLDASPERIEELKKQVEDAYEEARKLAQKLMHTRENAAQELGEKVTEELKSLAMEGSALQIRVTEKDTLDLFGMDTVAFEFMPFPGSPWLPLGKSASGGELSRLMLALELVAFEKKHAAVPSDKANEDSTNNANSDGDAVPTLIFDEIDAGVGGKAATELGKRLALLARGTQIIVVTHLPQVAAWAGKQFVVAKAKTDTSASTSVREVSGNARVEEIARMLSGSQTQTSLQHAEELLEECTL
ncbi:DNA repair protein RecN [Alloscardovia criceti]|uniref:DNA repair protein RecN n=1 Tax=Alloscardovia criceti TaxID=356828 RepID=UPI00036D3EAF|nr:DNA repair protein RecN [Alloscardovia criceti]